MLLRRRTTPPPPDTQPQRPRRSFGRRLAFVLVPLAIIPSLIVGGSGYLRSRQILETQAADQLSLITQSQVSRMHAWGALRTERLQIGAQREALKASISVLLQTGTDQPQAEEARQVARAELEGLKSAEGQVYFSDILVAGTRGGNILVSTNPAWEGLTLRPIVRGEINASSVQTRALSDDPVLSPSTFTLVSSAPVRAVSSTDVDSLLIGINSDLRIGALIQDMQVLQQQRGVFRVSLGETFLIIQPDIVVSLPRYSMSPTSQAGLQAPIFDSSAPETSGTAIYNSLGGEPVLGAYEWMPDWSIGVLIEIPLERIFGELDRLVPFLLIASLISVVLTMTAIAFTTNRMLRPLARLAEFAKRISQGEWLYRVPEDREDELGSVAEALNRMAQELSGIYRSLEVRVEERTKQIRTAAEVARAVTSVPTLDDLLRRAVELIRDQFGYYHVSIFLLDKTGQLAVLREATGEVGEALKARRHQLPVGSESVIGWVTEHNQARIVSNVSEDPTHFKNELLPETQSEAAVPLQLGGEVLGALDVQSTRADAFNQEALEILQTLADQLSAAIQNARLAEVSVAAAHRARLISDVTTQLSGLMEVDKVLETAVRSLHRALGQPEIMVQLAGEEDGAVLEAAAESETASESGNDRGAVGRE